MDSVFSAWEVARNMLREVKLLMENRAEVCVYVHVCILGGKHPGHKLERKHTS